MKTLIAIPSMDQVPAQFAQCLATLNKVGECAVSFQIGSLITERTRPEGNGDERRLRVLVRQ